MRQFIVTTTICLISLIIFSSPVGKPEPESVSPVFPGIYELGDTISSYFENAIDENRILGASVALVVGDSAWFEGGFGLRDIQSGDSIDANTVFRIGSVSKGFAAIAAGIFVERQSVDWNEKVVDLVSEFQMSNKEYAKQITLSHLLSHSSGLPYHSYTNLVEDGLSLTDIASRFNKVRSIAAPGEIYSYQNAAFGLSATMMERISKQSFEQILHSNVFEPLEMINASASFDALLEIDNLAKPHYRRNGEWRLRRLNRKYYNAIAAGGINASASDMGKWLTLLLGAREDLIRKSTLDEIYSPKVFINDKNRYYQKWDNFEASYYGMGWRIHSFFNEETKESDTLVHHGGYVNGYRTEIAIHPEKQLGVCVMFNSPNRFSKNVVPFLLTRLEEHVLKLQNWQDGLSREEKLAID